MQKIKIGVKSSLACNFGLIMRPKLIPFDVVRTILPSGLICSPLLLVLFLNNGSDIAES